MRFKWLEPPGAKRAREGSFSEIFLTRSLYLTIGAFIVMLLIVTLGGDVEPKDGKPLPELIFYLVLIAVGVSFFIRVVYWAAPATIHVNDLGIHYQMGSDFHTDKWADISGVRIEQRAGWKALAYKVNGAEQKEWGISAKVSAQGIINFAQRKT